MNPYMLSDREGRLAWRFGAACQAADPELFFPGSGSGPATQMIIAEAKRICRLCPVLIACGCYALEAREPYGIWGGMTEEERKDVLLGRRPVSFLGAVAAHEAINE